MPIFPVNPIGGNSGNNGATNALSLTDFPSSYEEQGGKLVAIASGETGTEFVSSTLPYGGLTAGGNNDASVLQQNTKAKFTRFNVNTPSNRVTPDHDQDHIRIDVTGPYDIKVSLSAKEGNGNNFIFRILKNNGNIALNNMEIRALVPAGNSAVPVVITGQANLTAGDTIELWLKNVESNANVTIDYISMTVLGMSMT